MEGMIVISNLYKFGYYSPEEVYPLDSYTFEFFSVTVAFSLKKSLEDKLENTIK